MHGLARTAIEDSELLGQQIRKGDSIYMWYAGANRHPDTFPNPNVIDLERENARDHLSFSAGHHRCLGSPLAKAEISEMIVAVFERLSNLRIDQDRVTSYPNIGGNYGFSAVPITFTPARKRATEVGG